MPGVARAVFRSEKLDAVEALHRWRDAGSAGLDLLFFFFFSASSIGHLFCGDEAPVGLSSTAFSLFDARGSRWRSSPLRRTRSRDMVLYVTGIFWFFTDRWCQYGYGAL
jgi:hypothetical protein